VRSNRTSKELTKEEIAKLLNAYEIFRRVRGAVAEMVPHYPTKRSALVPTLLYAQDEVGFLSDE